MSAYPARVLAVGAGPEQVHAIAVARAVGVHVAAVDGDPAAPGLTLAHTAQAVDIADVQGVTAFAAASQVEAVLPAPIGRFLTTVGSVNDALGLPGVTQAAAALCVDKRLQNAALRKAGVAVARQIALDGAGLKPAIADLGLPCVVKPNFGAGSRGVRLCANPGEIAELAASGVLQTGEWLVEQALTGVEFGVDAALFAGQFTPLMLREKVMTPPPYRQELLYLSPPRLDPASVAAVFDVVEVAARALGLRDCLINADVIVDAGGAPSIVELTGRAGGNNVSARIFPATYDADLVALALAALHSRKPVPPPTPKRAVAFAFLDLPAGEVVRFDPTRASASPGVIALESPLQAGDRLAPLRSGADAFQRGWLMATAATGQEALACARQALDEVEIAVEPILGETATG